MLSSVERYNISLIRQLEETDFSVRSQVDGHSYVPENLPLAPYFSLLDNYDKTGLHVDYGHSNFQLWQTSADTVMKPVYAGDSAFCHAARNL